MATNHEAGGCKGDSVLGWVDGRVEVCMYQREGPDSGDGGQGGGALLAGTDCFGITLGGETDAAHSRPRVDIRFN